MSWLKPRRKAKPKTGNIQFVKQWLYIYWNLPFFWVVKIGVTGHYWKRWIDVNKDNIGVDLPVFGIRCYLAYDIEQGNKEFCRRMRVHFFKGTGRTERFWIFAAIPAVLLSLLSFVVEWGLKAGAVYFFLDFLKNLPVNG